MYFSDIDEIWQELSLVVYKAGVYMEMHRLALTTFGF